MAEAEQQAVPGRQRKPKTKALIAARVKGMLAAVPEPATEGVQALNRGFFRLEAIRARTVANARRKNVRRKTIKG